MVVEGYVPNLGLRSAVVDAMTILVNDLVQICQLLVLLLVWSV